MLSKILLTAISLFMTLSNASADEPTTKWLQITSFQAPRLECTTQNVAGVLRQEIMALNARISFLPGCDALGNTGLSRSDGPWVCTNPCLYPNRLFFRDIWSGTWNNIILRPQRIDEITEAISKATSVCPVYVGITSYDELTHSVEVKSDCHK